MPPPMKSGYLVGSGDEHRNEELYSTENDSGVKINFIAKIVIGI